MRNQDCQLGGARQQMGCAQVLTRASNSRDESAILSTPANCQLCQRCTKCGEEKPFSEYYRYPKCKNGLHPHCKACHRAQTRRSELRNPEKKRASRAAYWSRQSPEYIRALRSLHRARRKQRCPQWLTPNDRRAIEALHSIARRVSACTGITWEVDHIVPLCGESVCGLHVPWNMRVIPAVANRRKGNRF